MDILSVLAFISPAVVSSLEAHPALYDKKFADPCFTIY